MYRRIEEYMQQGREERRAHLKLKTPCVAIGGTSGMFKGLLAHHLKTMVPHRSSVMLCHACNNGGCSNVDHLYWGTAKDNHIDSVEAGTYKRVFIDKEHASALGKRYGGMNKLSDDRIREIHAAIDAEPRTRGWIARVSRTLNVSHTQVRRYDAKQYRCRLPARTLAPQAGETGSTPVADTKVLKLNG